MVGAPARLKILAFVDEEKERSEEKGREGETVDEEPERSEEKGREGEAEKERQKKRRDVLPHPDTPGAPAVALFHPRRDLGAVDLRRTPDGAATSTVGRNQDPGAVRRPAVPTPQARPPAVHGRCSGSEQREQRPLALQRVQGHARDFWMDNQSNKMSPPVDPALQPWLCFIHPVTNELWTSNRLAVG